jgi:hypothetical protein
MKYFVRLSVLAFLAWTPAAFCDQVNVGDVSFIDLGNGTTQFYLDNFTGTPDGCSTPVGFPVCTDLFISGTLTYSYDDGSGPVDGSATLATPIGPDRLNGEASYAPANFLVPVIGADFLTASFSGSLSPADFTTDVGSFDSDGTVVSSDIVAGEGFALLVATSASATPIPEPSSIGFVLLGSLALLSGFRRQRRS